MEQRTCNKCGKTKALELFRKLGYGQYAAECLECAAENQRSFYAKNAHRINIKRSARLLARRAKEKHVDLQIFFEGEPV